MRRGLHARQSRTRSEELRAIKRTARYIFIAYLATVAFAAVVTVARSQTTTAADVCPGISGEQTEEQLELAMIEQAFCLHGFPPMSLEQYRKRIHNQHGWTNRALRNRCRPTLSLSEFTRTPLASVRFWWRDDRIDWARGRHHRAQSLSSACVPWYVAKQIAIANKLGAESAGDPWPNCPDPWDGSGAGWWTTVTCENRAYFELYGYDGIGAGWQTPNAWTDSPGYYRCGLQFDPGWEARYGRLCP